MAPVKFFLAFCGCSVSASKCVRENMEFPQVLVLNAIYVFLLAMNSGKLLLEMPDILLKYLLHPISKSYAKLVTVKTSD